MPDPFRDFINSLPAHNVKERPSEWAVGADDVVTNDLILERALDFIYEQMTAYGSNPTTQMVADALMLPASRVRRILEDEQVPTPRRKRPSRLTFIGGRGGWALSHFEMLGRIGAHS